MPTNFKILPSEKQELLCFCLVHQNQGGACQNKERKTNGSYSNYKHLMHQSKNPALFMLYLVYLMTKNHLFILFIWPELSNYYTYFHYYAASMQMTS